MTVLTPGLRPPTSALGVIAGEFGGGGLRRLIDGRGTRGELHRELSELAPSLTGRRLLRRRRVTWKPGRNARASFDLLLADSVVPVQLRWLLDRVEPPLCESSPSDLTVGLVPSHAAVKQFRRGDGGAAKGRVLVWPVDPDRPKLIELVAGGMAPLAPVVGHRSPPTVEVVRYRPGQRHVLAVTGSEAKIFLKVGRPAEVAVAMARAEAIERAMSPLPVQFAQAIWASEEFGAVAYGALPGRPLRLLIRSQAAGALPALTATGAMLSGVHRSDIPEATGAGLLPPLHPEREMAAVVRAADYVAVLAPDGFLSARTLAAEALALLSATAASSDMTLLHHDLKCDHVLVHRTGLGIIDLDAVGLGDPASDVARMLADLAWWTPPAGRPAVRRAFLAGYGRDDPGFRRRVAAWEALAIIKQAARRIPVLDLHLAERFSDQLVEARRAIDRAGGQRPDDS